MKITLITPVTPSSENIRSASALPFHLIRHRDKSIYLDIYSFNLNKLTDSEINSIEKELNAEIHILPIPKWYKLLLRLHLFIIRIFLKFPILRYFTIPQEFIQEIKKNNPDAIWFYGEEYTKIFRQFSGYKRVVTTPDCQALHYHRVLTLSNVSTSLTSLIRYIIMYHKYSTVVTDMPDDNNITYHLVGEEDRKFFISRKNSLSAVFLHHPHYNYSPNRLIKFSAPKVRILIAGRYDYYMKEATDKVVNMFIKHKNLSEFYTITFLGKDWSITSQRLIDNGYECNHIKYAPIYLEELIKHDIQITPISIGTGTKGKVLDAFTNGLLVIGTDYALENINSQNGIGYIKYGDIAELYNILIDIPQNINKYEQIAERGRTDILTNHNRDNISKRFFSLFK